MALKKIAENLWVIDVLRPILKFYFAELRTTIVKTQSGGLWVHSPTHLTSDLKSEIEKIGPVEFIIGPSNFHNLWLKQWGKAFPRAKTFVSSGIPKKIPHLKNNYQLLHDTFPHPPWEKDLQQINIEGVPFFDEFVFFHTATQSLIVTDLIQNHSCPQYHHENHLLGKILYHSFFRPLGFKNICLAPPYSWFFIKRDQTLLNQSLNKLLEWDFVRIIVAHGPIVEDNPKKTLRDLLKKNVQ